MAPGPDLVSSSSRISFLEACGTCSPLHLEIVPPGGGEAAHWDLPRPFAVVGRDPGMDIALAHETISRKHAYLQVIGGRFFWVDLGSRSGVSKGGERQPSGWLGADWPIAIGPYELRLPGRGRPETANDLEAASAEDPPINHLAVRDDLPGVTLEFLNKDTTWVMDDVLALVGRSPECKVQLKSRSVSRYHCSLLRTPKGVWVVDLFGRGRIAVNGRDVRFARLDDGDELGVGDFRIGLRCGPAPGPPTRRDALGDEGRSLPALRERRPAPPGLRRREAGGGTPVPVDAAAGERPTRDLAVRDVPETPDLPLRAELLDPSLAPLFVQFGQMQNQMFDQFQQLMVTMFQMFATMHRDEMGQLRDELDGLRRLTQEIDRLQAERAAHQAISAGRTANGTAGQNSGVASPQIGAARPEPAHEPSVPPPPQTDAGRREVAAARQPAPPDEEVHVLLTRRIAEIQQEQQSRWQKLLVTVIGRGGAP